MFFRQLFFYTRRFFHKYNLATYGAKTLKLSQPSLFVARQFKSHKTKVIILCKAVKIRKYGSGENGQKGEKIRLQGRVFQVKIGQYAAKPVTLS